MTVPAVRPARSFDLASRTFWVAVGQSTVKLSQIVVALVLVRVLSNAEWSRAALVISVYVAGYSFGALNLHQGVVFFLGRVEPSERRGVAVQTLLLLAATGVLTALVVLAATPLLARSTFHVGQASRLVALALCFEIPSLATSQFMLANERTGLAAAFDACFALLQLAALCVPLVLGLGLEVAARALCGYALLRLVVGSAFTLAMLPPGPWRAPRRLVGEQIAYTLPLALAMGMNVINRGVDKWLVAAITPLGFGAYAVAAQEVPLVSVVPYAIGAVLATRMVRAFLAGDHARVRAYWLAQTARMSMIVVPAALALILIAPEGILLVFTRDYDLAVLPFQLYSVILLQRVAEYGLVLRTAGQTRALWACAGVLLATNVLATLPLTYAFGTLGAAAGPLVASVASWLYALSRIRRALHTDWHGVFPWRIYRQVVWVASAAALATYFIVDAWPGAAGWSLVARLVTKLGLFVPLLWAGFAALRLRASLPPVPADA